MSVVHTRLSTEGSSSLLLFVIRTAAAERSQPLVLGFVPTRDASSPTELINITAGL